MAEAVGSEVSGAAADPLIPDGSGTGPGGVAPAGAVVQPPAAGGAPPAPTVPAAPAQPAAGEPSWKAWKDVDKFLNPTKDGIDVEKLHGSLEWAMGKLGGRTGAPEPDEKTGNRYALNAPEGMSNMFEDSDPDWKLAQDLFGELDLDQASVDKLVRFETVLRAKEAQLQVEDQRTLLETRGYDVTKRQEIADWGKRTFGPDWDKARFAFLRTADGVQAFNEVLRPMISRVNIPSNLQNGAPVTGTPDRSTLARMGEQVGQSGGLLKHEDSPAGEAHRKAIRAMAEQIGRAEGLS